MDALENLAHVTWWAGHAEGIAWIGRSLHR
jgi:hypothetical protein